MILPFVPEMFDCTTCGERWPVDMLCSWTFETAERSWCVRCCGCQAHQGDSDPGGSVVFTVEPGALRWRGLDGSPWRTRRHQ